MDTVILQVAIHSDVDVDGLRIHLAEEELKLGERLTEYNIASGARLSVQSVGGGQQAGIAHVLATAEACA